MNSFFESLLANVVMRFLEFALRFLTNCSAAHSISHALQERLARRGVRSTLRSIIDLPILVVRSHETAFADGLAKQSILMGMFFFGSNWLGDYLGRYGVPAFSAFIVATLAVVAAMIPVALFLFLTNRSYFGILGYPIFVAFIWLSIRSPYGLYQSVGHWPGTLMLIFSVLNMIYSAWATRQLKVAVTQIPH